MRFDHPLLIRKLRRQRNGDYECPEVRSPRLFLHDNIRQVLQHPVEWQYEPKWDVSNVRFDCRQPNGGLRLRHFKGRSKQRYRRTRIRAMPHRVEARMRAKGLGETK